MPTVVTDLLFQQQRNAIAKGSLSIKLSIPMVNMQFATVVKKMLLPKVNISLSIDLQLAAQREPTAQEVAMELWDWLTTGRGGKK